MENRCMIDSKFQLGKAGEHLVCFDLLSKGFNVSMASETLPYDLLMDNGKRILKVQVKTTLSHKKTNQWRGVNDAYVFSIKRKGSSGLKKYGDNEVDLFAVVAIDSMQVGYIKNEDMPTTINIRVDELKGKYHDEKGFEFYSTIQKLKSEKKTLSEIMKIMSLSETSVRNYMSDDFKAFITNARYMSDLKRDKLWFM